MSQPRFSIVIPSRNRGMELYHTLRTCIAQDYAGDFEIIVSDNDSSDDIRGVVASIGDSRVRYFRAPQYLPMTESWEFAVQQARGEYVGIVCTDDGFLFNALREVAAVIDASGADIVTYQHAYYYWPSYADPALRRRLLVPNFVFTEGLHAGSVLVNDAFRTLHYGRLPCFLNSFCHRDVLDRVRQRSGRLFASLCPDIYAGFLLGSMSDKIYVMNRVVGIGGVSGNSTGGNAQLDPLGPATQGYIKEYKGERFLDGLIDFPFGATAIIDSGVKALNALGIRTSVAEKINPRSYLVFCYRQAMLFSPGARPPAFAAIETYLRAQPGAWSLRCWLAAKRLQWALKAILPVGAVRALQSTAHRFGIGGGALAPVNERAGEELLFDDVFEAARSLSPPRSASIKSAGAAHG
jgi:glycosyltransferase involved in cell wall biosynthesis